MFDLICERSAPISEHGRHNVGSDGADKFELLRNLMLNYTSTTPPPEAPFVPISAYGAATLPLSVSLLDIAQQISAGALSAKQPLTLEEVCPNATILIYSFPSANFYRFVHPPDSIFQGRLSVYFLALGALAWPLFLDLRRLIVLMRTCLRPQPKMLRLAVDKVRDRAHVVVRGEGGDSLAGIIDRKKGGEGVVALPGGPEHGKMTRIDIILEAMGRANYGPFMGGERKGITQGRFRPRPQIPYFIGERAQGHHSGRGCARSHRPHSISRGKLNGEPL